jgi:hypothetical protein
MHGLQKIIDERTDLLLAMKLRKVTPELGWPVYLVPIDGAHCAGRLIVESGIRRDQGLADAAGGSMR